MRPYDDRVPEEQDPQYEELITFLQHANLSPKLVDPTLRTHFLSQVRARLIQTDSGASLPEDLSEPEMQELGSLPSKPKVRRGKQYQRGRVVQLFSWSRRFLGHCCYSTGIGFHQGVII